MNVIYRVNPDNYMYKYMYTELQNQSIKLNFVLCVGIQNPNGHQKQLKHD